MTERPVQHDPDVVEGDDEPPRPPETTRDPYVPHMQDRQGWASRSRVILWAWVPVVVVVALVVWAHYH
jgi:hypothetical protein